MDNSARKTVPKQLKPFKKGHDPRRGHGLKGRSGRTPDEFKAMCQDLVSSDAVRDAVVAALKNPQHPAFLGSLKWATEHGYGAPAKSVDVTSGGKPISGVVLIPATE